MEGRVLGKADPKTPLRVVSALCGALVAARREHVGKLGNGRRAEGRCPTFVLGDSRSNALGKRGLIVPRLNTSGGI